MKLFRIRVQCHHLEELNAAGTADWRNPYYTTEVGLGFAGYCFEAMTIITLFSRAMEQLVSDAGEPRPNPTAISNILAKIVRDYFSGHANKAAWDVHFLLFGYHGPEAWVARLDFTAKGLTGPTVEPLVRHKVHAIPDARDGAFVASTHSILDRIAKHADDMREQVDVELDLEQARHRDAAKKSVEESLLDKIENEFNATVGGSVQKLEVYRKGDSAAVAYTRETRSDILDHLPLAGDRLCYMPIDEQLGRKKR
jgi:hypothetical protein